MSVIDTYLQDIPSAQRAALERIRVIVKQMVPDAEEVISYGMPTFKHNGKPLLHIAAFKDHMSIFPTGDPMVDTIGDELKKFRTSKGTLQFTEDAPIPETVIKQIIAVRLSSIASSSSS